MKKTLIFVLGLSSLCSFAQSNEKLQKTFSDESLKNQKKFDLYIKNLNSRLSEKQISEMKSKLAGFAGKIPVFLESDDNRANKSANIISLQDGTLYLEKL
jgi:hypothetical protein